MNTSPDSFSSLCQVWWNRGASERGHLVREFQRFVRRLATSEVFTTRGQDVRAPIAFALTVVSIGILHAAPLEWKEENGFRRAALTIPGAARAGFSLMPASTTEIAFTNVLEDERGITNQIYFSGSGVAAGDIDGDGLTDLYFCSLNGGNALYRNLGEWKFENKTDRAGVRCAGQASTGAAFADVDGDGDLDLLVSSIGHGVRLFTNDGRGKFTETTSTAGLVSDHASMTMAFADIDGDGDLDLYVANYRSSTFQDEVNVRFRISTTNGVSRIVSVNGRPASAPDLTNRYYLSEQGAIEENGEADVLYLNDGRGKFSAASWIGGRFLDEDGKALKSAPLDWGLSAMFRDMNGDGAPDLYVCNDGDSPGPHLDQRWAREFPRVAAARNARDEFLFDGRGFRRHQSRWLR
jgi:hypothetical protein